MTRVAAAGIFAAVMALPASAGAHDTWIVPRRAVTPGRLAIFFVTSSMTFPGIETGPRASRLADGGWRVGDHTGPFTGRAEDDSTLALAAVPEGEGTAVAWVAFHPREIDLDEDEVTHYLDEIGAGDDIRAAWAASGTGRTWHETYTKLAKTFVRTGGVGDDASCLAPVGLALELVPDRDPTGLAAGDTVTVRVLQGGKGLPGIAVGAVCGRTGAATMERANEAGYVRIAITGGGPWLVRATDLRARSGGTWESVFTTLTFEAEGR